MRLKRLSVVIASLVIISSFSACGAANDAAKEVQKGSEQIQKKNADTERNQSADSGETEKNSQYDLE